MTESRETLAVIPARYDSRRFPGKVLARMGRRTLLELVYEKASRCRGFSRIVVATDD